MDIFSRVWKCMELRESLQERRLAQIERMKKVIDATSSGCPETSSHFYYTYLNFSLNLGAKTVGSIDCDEARKNLDVLDRVLSRIESGLPICGRNKEEVENFFRGENET